MTHEGNRGLLGLVLAFGACATLLGVALVACGGSSESEVETNLPDEPTGRAASALKGAGGHCTLTGGGGSGNTTSCQGSETFACPGGSVTITCTCGDFTSAGSCTCGSQTFPFDCSNQCTITRTQQKTCGIK
jgi:hypothetical protein